MAPQPSLEVLRTSARSLSMSFSYSGKSGIRQYRSPERAAASSRRSYQPSSLAMTPAATFPSMAQMAPVRVATSTRRVQPSSRMAQVRASARISRPSASVLRTSMVWPESEVIRSPGRVLSREIRFSQAGITAVTFTFAPTAARARTAAATAAPPAMSPFMVSMDLPGLRQ